MICRRTMPLWVIAALLLLLLSALNSVAAGFDPPGIMLTWQQDPTTTMTIDWHSYDEKRPSELEFRALGEQAWRSAEGDARPFPFSLRTIHRVLLTGLSPAATYELRFAEEGPVYRFRTMPEDATRPIRFAAGGDTMHAKEWMDAVNRQAARFDVDFAVFGGDLAYANGDPRRAANWYQWFESLKTYLRTPEDRLIPVIVGIGNHEVYGLRRLERDGVGHLAAEYGLENGDAPYFSTLFAFPGKPHYGVLDFGDYMSIILLDTNHTNPVAGTQTEWLEQTLQARQHMPHKFPVYHVPAYPSVRDYDGTTNQHVREHWTPLFERYGVKTAFENHDHAYKRTPPIRGEALDSNGVVYLGDGAWGVGIREVHSADETWYLERSESVRHAIIVTIQGQHQHFIAVDEAGNVFDEYPEPVAARR